MADVVEDRWTPTLNSRGSVSSQPHNRTPQACLPCRRRKVKCNGARPRCRHCLKVHDKCRWPASEANHALYSVAPSPVESPTSLLAEAQTRILIDRFFSVPHLAFMRQSVHRPTFESTNLNEHPRFLLLAICSLAALSLSESDVTKDFNGDPAMQVSQRLAAAAQHCSRESSDQPSVASIQANALLGFRELLCRTGSKAWMYVGLAIRMAQELRLGKEYNQRHSPREREIRRRTMWICFILDRLLCIVTARPQAIKSRQISVQLPCPEKSFLFDEDFRVPGLPSFPDSNSDQAEVLSYFVKAIDLWGVMIDLLGTIGNSSPKGPIDYEEEFLKADAAVKEWILRLPARMKWSIRNYRTFRMLGEGNLFVSLHLILNHALCALHQAHFPQPDYSLSPSMVNLPITSSSQGIVATCLHHANELTQIASSLSNGDATDREMLRSPFAGVAMMSAACVHLWSLHTSDRPTENDTNKPGDYDSASRNLLCLMDILRSWIPEWPVATSWLETIELVSALYAVAYGRDTTIDLDDIATRDADEEHTPPSPERVTLGSGVPEPSTVSNRLFEKIRHILFTTSESSALRQRQTRLHIRNLWGHMCLQAQMASMNTSNAAGDGRVPFFDLDSSDPDILFGWDGYLEGLESSLSMGSEISPDT